MNEIVRYQYRLRPGVQAEQALITEWHRCRFIWNEAVYQQKTGRRPTRCKLQKLLTEARSKFTWLRDGSRVAQTCVIGDYASALDHSYKVKGRRKPVVKKRHSTLPSLAYTYCGFKIKNQRLCLAKGIVIPVVWSRELPANPTSVRVYQDSIGHWYASFVVRREVELRSIVDGKIGIDWGVAVTATTTDPEFDLPYAGYRRRCAAELAACQRRMSRRRRPRGHASSHGYKKSKLDTAKVHKKAKRQNLHTGRVWAQSVVARHQLIAIEDLRSRFLTKTTMARKAADAGITTIKNELVSIGRRAGRKVVLVPPAYTTMTCSSCFARNKQRLGLGERIFRCDACGYTADRDRNAARTILATAETVRVDVDDVRHGITSLLDRDTVQSESRIE